MMMGAVNLTFHNNAPMATLPLILLYNVAKEMVEKAMSGADTGSSTNPAPGADQVVWVLSKCNLPYWVWQGKFSLLAWVASHFPGPWMAQ